MRLETQLTSLRARAMQYAHTGILITDARMSDNPIIDCNPAFEVITGYSRNEVLGKNCRFLQGNDTDERTLELIKEAVEAAQHVTVVIKNFRKDGSMFWNELSISPVFEGGELTHFIGIQNNVTVRETARLEMTERNHELNHINEELHNKSRQQKEIDARIKDLLKQSHSL